VQEGDRSVLYCKGAESAIRLLDSTPCDRAFSLSSSGLRTLVFASKSFSDEDVALWLNQFHATESSASNREALIAEAADALEVGLRVIGIAGLEDCIQAGVSEAIAWIVDAGIHIWVVT
jgi:magnesium-transporting ATPase (P-type)